MCFSQDKEYKNLLQKTKKLSNKKNMLLETGFLLKTKSDCLPAGGAVKAAELAVITAAPHERYFIRSNAIKSFLKTVGSLQRYIHIKYLRRVLILKRVVLMYNICLIGTWVKCRCALQQMFHNQNTQFLLDPCLNKRRSKRYLGSPDGTVPKWKYFTTLCQISRRYTNLKRENKYLLHMDLI